MGVPPPRLRGSGGEAGQPGQRSYARLPESTAQRKPRRSHWAVLVL